MVGASPLVGVPARAGDAVRAGDAFRAGVVFAGVATTIVDEALKKKAADFQHRKSGRPR